MVEVLKRRNSAGQHRVKHGVVLATAAAAVASFSNVNIRFKHSNGCRANRSRWPVKSTSCVPTRTVTAVVVVEVVAV